MVVTNKTRSAEIRARLKHPVIDCDGHTVEFMPPLEDYVKAAGGSDYEVRLTPSFGRGQPEADEARKDVRAPRPPWWGVPAKNTLDRATAALPKLLHERMDEFGLDYTVLFGTTLGVDVRRKGSMNPFDAEAAQVRARAVNTYRAEICREFADRMTPVATVPMHTPSIAIEELEHAVKNLGLKTIAISAVLRPIPSVMREFPDLYKLKVGFSTLGCWLDTFGIDSDYDYDPFWAKCAELKVPVMTHGQGMGFTTRNSATNYMYNHIGHFASAGEAMAKALFMGGVTRRFPTLRFAFLEGGAATGCRLYADLVGHWQKRNARDLENYNPNNLDRELFLDLHQRYGGKMVEGRMDRVLTGGQNLEPEHFADTAFLDDFARCEIRRPEDIRDLFIPRFFFGCEADDPTNAIAFNPKLWPMGARINAMFSSDIGHWDVPDMTKVLEEAYELVEEGNMTPEDFRDFTLANPVRFFAGVNPDFFKGTVVEASVERLISEHPSALE